MKKKKKVKEDEEGEEKGIGKKVKMIKKQTIAGVPA